LTVNAKEGFTLSKRQLIFGRGLNAMSISVADDVKNLLDEIVSHGGEVLSCVHLDRLDPVPEPDWSKEASLLPEGS
jgi:hypothetical protein